jgi:hypothetical protein
MIYLAIAFVFGGLVLRGLAHARRGTCEYCASDDICPECKLCADSTCNAGCIYCRDEIRFGPFGTWKRAKR